jgi:hypothetical protein
MEKKRVDDNQIGKDISISGLAGTYIAPSKATETDPATIFILLIRLLRMALPSSQ